jgi:hypothetical protein
MDPLLVLGEVTDADGSEDVIYHFVKGTRDLGEKYPPHGIPTFLVLIIAGIWSGIWCYRCIMMYRWSMDVNA